MTVTALQRSRGARARTSGQYRPVFAALVRAVCPPDGMTDELIGATVDEADAFVGDLSPTTRRALLTLAGVLEHGTRVRHGLPFSAMDPVDAREVLARWRRGPLGRGLQLLRDVVVVAHYEQPQVRTRVGYNPDPYIADKRAERLESWSGDIASHRRLLVTPATLSPIASLRSRSRESPSSTDVGRPGDRRPGGVGPDGDRAGDQAGAIRPGAQMPSRLECDVVVVGSGAGGGVMAAELAEAGLSVVVLEEGAHHATESFTTSTTRALRTLYRDGGATATLGRAPVGYAEGRCVGGGTVVNGGMAFRASESVLSRWTAATTTTPGSSVSCRWDDPMPDRSDATRTCCVSALSGWAGGSSRTGATTSTAAAATSARGGAPPAPSSRPWSATCRVR